MDIYQLIADANKLDEASLKDLGKLVEEYPFFHPARLLYVQNLFKLRQPSFGQELQRASLLVPDRQALFSFVEGESYDVLHHERPLDDSPIMTEDDENRTISLIDNFLSIRGSETERSAEPHPVPTVAEVTSDYAAFLSTQAEPASADEEAEMGNTLQGAALIDSFISQTSGRQRYDISQLEDEPKEDAKAGVKAEPKRAVSTSSADATEDRSPLLTDETEEAPFVIYNERIANLYLKQGRYDEALEIFRKISLDNPEKSATFADKIQLLEVIVTQRDTETKS